MAITLDIINNVLVEISKVDIHSIETRYPKHYEGMIRRVFIVLVDRHAPQLLHLTKDYLNISNDSNFIRYKRTTNFIYNPKHRVYRTILYDCSNILLQNYPTDALRKLDIKEAALGLTFGR